MGSSGIEHATPAFLSGKRVSRCRVSLLEVLRCCSRISLCAARNGSSHEAESGRVQTLTHATVERKNHGEEAQARSRPNLNLRGKQTSESGVTYMPGTSGARPISNHKKEGAVLDHFWPRLQILKSFPFEEQKRERWISKYLCGQKRNGKHRY